MECSFCGQGIERGTESIFVTKKGKALYFCSSKCEKNLLKLKRRPRRVGWTSAHREEKAIRIRSGHVPSAKKEKEVEELLEELKEEKKPEKNENTTHN